MKKIQYQIKYKIKCPTCGHLGFPYIKMITFKNSDNFTCAAYCRKCDRYIDNIPKTNVQVKGKGTK